MNDEPRLSGAELEDRAAVLVGGHAGWRGRFARWLGVNDRTLRRWLQHDDVPPWVAERVADAEWYIGTGMVGDRDEPRELIMHLSEPRFVGWVMQRRPSAVVRPLCWLDWVDAEDRAVWVAAAHAQLDDRMATEREDR